MRKLGIAFLVVTAVLATSGAPAGAWEHHRFGGPRVFVGPLWFPPYAYPYPYAYGYPPPVVIEPAPDPQVYVQPQQAPPEESYWYYCENSKTYYPYVSQCPSGWLKVVPRTSPPSAALPPAQTPGPPGAGAQPGPPSPPPILSR
jgi:hypothetical protein